MSRARILALALAPLMAAPAQAPAAGEHWAWPVRGPVVSAFRLGPDPFAAGQHRGVDIAAPAGMPVRAACAGVVRFAGRAGDSGRVVSVACGGFVVSYLHLARAGVRRGEDVDRGQRLGTVGTTGRRSVAVPHLHLGVRRAAGRWDYVDPLSLLPTPARREPPTLPAARGDRRPLGPAPAPGRPIPRPRPVPVTRPAPAGAPTGAPGLVWAGLALVALGAPAGALARRRLRPAARPQDVRRRRQQQRRGAEVQAP